MVDQTHDDTFEHEGPKPLSVLEQHGITASDIQKFIDAGYNTVEAISYTPKKTLVQVKGISEAKLEKFLAACQKEV